MTPRRLALVAVAGMALALLPALTACGTGGTSPSPSPSSTPQLPSVARTAAPPKVEAWSGTLIVRRSGRVLWSKAPLRELQPASCTKIMTALLTLERVPDLNRYATVPHIHLPQTVGVDLVPGDRIKVRQALYALLVKSANDAALTLASYVGGSEKRFVKLMNRRAAQLGMRHTHFKNCRGTVQPGHYSCARDLAVLGRFAMRDATFRRIVATKSTVIRYPPDNAVPVTSHNRLLDYPWGNGVKTGATTASGKVLVGSGKPGPVALISVTMHEPSRDQEVKDTLALFAWGSAQFARPALAASGSPAP